MSVKYWIVLALMVGSGCGKHEPASGKSDIGSPTKESVSTQLPPEQAAQIEAQFLPPATPAGAGQRPGAAIQDRLDGAIHTQLTAQLRMFKVLKGRMPENFYEFANTVGDSVPRLPDGMKFAIDPVDQTVKAVKK